MKIVFHSLCKTTTLVQIKALTKYNFDLISLYNIIGLSGCTVLFPDVPVAIQAVKS